jgi:protein SCO1/2
VAADAPDAFGAVPDFALTSQSGARVTLATLAGRPFVLSAIFSTCVGPCPRISQGMREIQGALLGTDALLVSITVDPGHDTPEVLAEYARGFGADPQRWLFLTGEKAALHELVRRGFLMAVEDDPTAPTGAQVTHDTRLVAVDRQGVLRGWYDGTTAAGRAALVARLRFLAREERR